MFSGYLKLRKYAAGYHSFGFNVRETFFAKKACKRRLAIKEAASGDSRFHVYTLKNNFNSKDYPAASPYAVNPIYIEKSINAFLSILKPHFIYILVEKAVRSSKGILFGGEGHITSLITDKNAEIDDSLTVSLRPGGVLKVKDSNETIFKTLTSSFAFLGQHNGNKRVEFVQHVKFVPWKEELQVGLLDEAQGEIQNERYLIGLPIDSLLDNNINDHVTQTRELKLRLIDKWFIIMDGHIEGITYKALNCVTGFYGRFYLQSTTSNPSPQMAAWSYLAHSYGTEVRDKIIGEINLRDINSGERTYDDKLESITTENLASLQTFQK